jgi:hypothetical protein
MTHGIVISITAASARLGTDDWINMICLRGERHGH